MACLGTWRARKFAERRGTAQAARRCWAGAAAGAAVCGRVGGASLLVSAQRMSAAVVIVFGLMVSKKVQLLLLQHAGSIRSFWRGAVLGEAGLRVLSVVGADVWVSCGGRVRRLGARAGVLVCLWSVLVSGLCAQCWVCNAVLWSCVCIAWGMLGRGSRMCVCSMRPQFARVGAGDRMARRWVLRHWVPSVAKKSFFRRWMLWLLN